MNISDPALSFTSNNRSAQRPGGDSCYPAAFTELPASHCIFVVRLTSTQSKHNWLTFGVCKRGFPAKGSEGIGRARSSWGVCDDRSTESNPIVSADGNTVADFPRKLHENDLLSAEINLSESWLELRLNHREHVHRITLPSNLKASDMLFGMTFANGLMATIEAPTVTVKPSSTPLATPPNAVSTFGFDSAAVTGKSEMFVLSSRSD
jgi:hypothetical protein